MPNCRRRGSADRDEQHGDRGGRNLRQKPRRTYVDPSASEGEQEAQLPSARSTRIARSRSAPHQAAGQATPAPAGKGPRVPREVRPPAFAAVQLALSLRHIHICLPAAGTALLQLDRM